MNKYDGINAQIGDKVECINSEFVITIASGITSSAPKIGDQFIVCDIVPEGELIKVVGVGDHTLNEKHLVFVTNEGSCWAAKRFKIIPPDTSAKTAIVFESLELTPPIKEG